MKTHCHRTHTHKISINPMELNLIMFAHCCRAFGPMCSLSFVWFCGDSTSFDSAGNCLEPHFFPQLENIFIFQLMCATMLLSLCSKHSTPHTYGWDVAESEWLNKINLHELKWRKNQLNSATKNTPSSSPFPSSKYCNGFGILKNQFHFNFMQIILTKSNKMKLPKQIGHLRLFIAWYVFAPHICMLHVYALYT